MKLIFSETNADYEHYIFPYAIWAIPEPGEAPHEFFARGFLPSTKELDRYYLCRSVRVNLKKFKPSSENRRIFKKNTDIQFELIERADFYYNPARRDFFKKYADIRFGKNVMSFQRLDNLFNSPITSHSLRYAEQDSGTEVGVATLFLDAPVMAHYYYAFYDLNYYEQNLGMFMMTSAVDFFASRGFDFLYLGSCYSRNALYKTQFEGAEFFNGGHWSHNLNELKAMIQRDQKKQDQHLLETDDFLNKFYDGRLDAFLQKGSLRIQIDSPSPA
ncbi:hypothetical protein JXJ21_23910 [candidate division KSB1 bacterium]|nr:hypothetical protein [candidate division KSB1 bacterium]